VAIAFACIQAVQYAIVGALPMSNGWIDPKDVPNDANEEHNLYFQPTDKMKEQLTITVIVLFVMASLASRLLQMIGDMVKQWQIKTNEAFASLRLDQAQ